jgi:UDP-N-acetylmuramoyl-tripeptide--D-alanyl-D-alanine ligase
MKTILKKIIVWILTLEAKIVLARFKPKIVAITGSVGKTSAKDAIAAVLATKFSTRKSEKSFNSEIGAPLTVLGLPNGWNNPLAWLVIMVSGALVLFRRKYSEWLVLEIGADRPGDIKKLAFWLKPDVVVITRFAKVPVHVEYFDSPEKVIEEKASLIKALKLGGTLILYAGDKEAEALKPRAEGRMVVTYGLVPHADVRASDAKLLFEEGKTERWPIGMSAQVVIDGTSAPVEVVGAIGEHALLPALAGATVGKALGKPMEEIIKALGRYII